MKTKEEMLAYWKEYAQRPEVKIKRYLYEKKKREENRDKIRGKNREYVRRIRVEIIEHYGNKCACCGETTLAFLTIDHINGGGNNHRKEVRSGSIGRWCRSHGYPDGFQVLCFNCNSAKSICGVCPHKQPPSKDYVAGRRPPLPS